MGATPHVHSCIDCQKELEGYSGALTASTPWALACLCRSCARSYSSRDAAFRRLDRCLFEAFGPRALLTPR
jgi:hypothetical protein